MQQCGRGQWGQVKDMFQQRPHRAIAAGEVKEHGLQRARRLQTVVFGGGRGSLPPLPR